MDITILKQIIELIKREVVPAIGCTEPMAVALAVAKASETLAKTPQKIDVFLSANVLKNAMGVGIPGTGMIGLPIAVALGALIGKSQYGLEVLRDITPQSLEEGKNMIEKRCIDISLKDNVDKLYIEVICRYEAEYSKVIVSISLLKNRSFLGFFFTKLGNISVIASTSIDESKLPLRLLLLVRL